MGITWHKEETKYFMPLFVPVGGEMLSTNFLLTFRWEGKEPLLDQWCSWGLIQEVTLSGEDAAAIFLQPFRNACREERLSGRRCREVATSVMIPLIQETGCAIWGCFELLKNGKMAGTWDDNEIAAIGRELAENLFPSTFQWYNRPMSLMQT